MKNKLIILLRIFLSILALYLSFILADFQLTTERISYEMATTGLRGLPIPYRYMYSAAWIGGWASPILLIDMLFWLLIFNTALDKWLLKKVELRWAAAISILSVLVAGIILYWAGAF